MSNEAATFEDKMVALAAAVAAEQHALETAIKTQTEKDFQLADEARQFRQRLWHAYLKEGETDKDGQRFETGELHCLVPSTIIYTAPVAKKISEIRLGERVMDYHGQTQKITGISRRPINEKIMQLSIGYSGPLQITKNHRVLCAENVRKPQTIWRKTEVNPCIVWKEADKLTRSDFLLVPRFRQIEDLTEISLTHIWTNLGQFTSDYVNGERHLEKSIRVDDDLMRLTGLYLAEGCATERDVFFKKEQRSMHNRSIRFSFGKHEKRLHEFTRRTMSQIFDHSGKLHENKTTIELTSGQVLVFKYFSQFGRNSYEKKMTEWILHLPDEKLYPLLRGMFEGDGCRNKFCMQYATVSSQLALQLHLLLMQMGYLNALKSAPAKTGKLFGRETISQMVPSYQVIVAGDSARNLAQKLNLEYDGGKRVGGNHGCILGDYVMLPIRKIEEVNYEGDVYNLEVENTESYLTASGVVHNCALKHMLQIYQSNQEVLQKRIREGAPIEEQKELAEISKETFAWVKLLWTRLAPTKEGENG